MSDFETFRLFIFNYVGGSFCFPILRSALIEIKPDTVWALMTDDYFGANRACDFCYAAFIDIPCGSAINRRQLNQVGILLSRVCLFIHLGVHCKIDLFQYCEHESQRAQTTVFGSCS